jgi:hypothetical protein
VCVCGVEVVCVSVRRWRPPAARPPPATPGPGPETAAREEEKSSPDPAICPSRRRPRPRPGDCHGGESNGGEEQSKSSSLPPPPPPGQARRERRRRAVQVQQSALPAAAPRARPGDGSESGGEEQSKSSSPPPAATAPGPGPGTAARVTEKISPDPAIGPPRHRPRARPGDGSGSECGGGEEQPRSSSLPARRSRAVQVHPFAPPAAAPWPGPGTAVRVAEKSSPSPPICTPPRCPRVRPGDGGESGGEEQPDTRKLHHVYPVGRGGGRLWSSPRSRTPAAPRISRADEVEPVVNAGSGGSSHHPRSRGGRHEPAAAACMPTTTGDAQATAAVDDRRARKSAQFTRRLLTLPDVRSCTTPRLDLRPHQGLLCRRRVAVGGELVDVLLRGWLIPMLSFLSRSRSLI